MKFHSYKGIVEKASEARGRWTPPEKIYAAYIAAMEREEDTESCTRVQELGWKHHQVVANHPQASELLEWASEEGATTRQLAAEKKRLAQAPMARQTQRTRRFYPNGMCRLWQVAGRPASKTAGGWDSAGC